MSYTVRREVPRMRGPGRAILVTLLVLALLAVGADFGLRLLAERWLEGRVQETLELESRPDLDIGGFPFLLQFARGEFERVDVTLEDFRVRGVQLDEVTIGLRDVRFDRADVIAGRPGAVEVGRGGATVEIGEPAFNAFLREQGIPVTVELLGPRVRASTSLEVGGEEATATTVGRVTLDDRTLTFDPGEVRVDGSFGVPPAALAFGVALPPLFEGMTYEGVEVREAVLALRANLDDTVLDLG